MRDSKVTSRKGARFDRDWTKGSIVRNLFSLSWPMMVGDSINTIGPVIDMIWVAKLGAASLAGVGIASLAFLIVQFGVQGLLSGMRAMVARFVGAGENEAAVHVAQQNLVVLGAYAAIMTSIGIVFAEHILKLFRVAPDVVTQGAAYMRIAFLSSGIVAFHKMTEIIMQASGDSVTPMKISIIARIVHAAICPFLIFGWWIFPRWGVTGAAVANLFSLSLAMSLGLWVVFTGRSRLCLTLKHFHFDPGIIWRIVKIGVPSGIMSAQMSISNIVLMSFIIPFGTVAIASHTLVGNIMGYATVPSLSLGRGCGVLVGQNLGAKHPERAERCTWLTTFFGEIIVTIFLTIVLVWSVNLMRLFSPEREIINMSSIFLKIGIGSMVAHVFSFTFEQSLSGAGDTIPPMFISLIRIWAVALPLAYLLSHFSNFGVYGVRGAMVAGDIAAALASVIYFQTGRWKRKRV